MPFPSDARPIRWRPGGAGKCTAVLAARLYQRIRGVTYREFNQHGLELTPEQWIVLARLWQRDGRTVSELSESTLRDKPTMSRILDSMEKSGLVTRTVDSKDARTRIVALTREGKALRKKLVPIAKSIVASSRSGRARRRSADHSPHPPPLVRKPRLNLASLCGLVSAASFVAIVAMTTNGESP